MKERAKQGRQNKEEKGRMEGRKEGGRKGGGIGVFNLSVFQLSFSIQAPTPPPWDQWFKPNLWVIGGVGGTYSLAVLLLCPCPEILPSTTSTNFKNPQ